jgi:hypothetical protein
MIKEAVSQGLFVTQQAQTRVAQPRGLFLQQSRDLGTHKTDVLLYLQSFTS